VPAAEPAAELLPELELLPAAVVVVGKGEAEAESWWFSQVGKTNTIPGGVSGEYDLLGLLSGEGCFLLFFLRCCCWSCCWRKSFFWRRYSSAVCAAASPVVGVPDMW